MSRHAITSIYETAIASRPHTLQLLNEITNSPKNIERFKEVYCPWFPFGDVGERGWGWTWPSGPGYNADPDRVKNYNTLFQSQKYPDPARTRVNYNGINISYYFSNIFIYSLQISLLRQGETWKQQYELMLTHLLEKDKEAKINAGFVNTTVKEKVEKNSIWSIDLQYSIPRKRDLYQVRYVLDDLVIHFIIIYFMRMQKILPQKDIFKYGSVLDLLQALSSAKSARQQKSTKGAEVKKEIPGLIYEDDNVLVVEPQSWAFSRRYFGAPQRHSLITDGKIIEGAKWCTAASSFDHWGKFVDFYKNHLYYFVDKKTEELYAIRTAGGGDVNTGDLNQLYKRMASSVFTTAHSAELMTRARDKLLAKPAEVIDFNKKLISGYLTKFDVDTPGLMQTISHFKDDDYQAYTEYFTHEARNQQNEQITMQSIFDKYGLDINWVKKHLKFVDYLD